MAGGRRGTEGEEQLFPPPAAAAGGHHAEPARDAAQALLPFPE